MASNFWSGLAQGGGAAPGNYNLGSAASTYGGYAGQDRAAISNPQGTLNTMTQAAISSGMPQLDQQLQRQQESNVQRGVSTGDLGTSFEGDITSAFQKNIANATAAQAGNLFNTQAGIYNSDSSNYLDLLSGNADRAQSEKNSKTDFWSSLLGGAAKAAPALLAAF